MTELFINNKNCLSVAALPHTNHTTPNNKNHTNWAAPSHPHVSPRLRGNISGLLTSSPLVTRTRGGRSYKSRCLYPCMHAGRGGEREGGWRETGGRLEAIETVQRKGIPLIRR